MESEFSLLRFLFFTIYVSPSFHPSHSAVAVAWARVFTRGFFGFSPSRCIHSITTSKTTCPESVISISNSLRVQESNSSPVQCTSRPTNSWLRSGRRGGGLDGGGTRKDGENPPGGCSEIFGNQSARHGCYNVKICPRKKKPRNTPREGERTDFAFQIRCMLGCSFYTMPGASLGSNITRAPFSEQYTPHQLAKPPP